MPHGEELKHVELFIGYLFKISMLYYNGNLLLKARLPWTTGEAYWQSVCPNNTRVCAKSYTKDSKIVLDVSLASLVETKYICCVKWLILIRKSIVSLDIQLKHIIWHKPAKPQYLKQLPSTRMSNLLAREPVFNPIPKTVFTKCFLRAVIQINRMPSVIIV